MEDHKFRPTDHTIRAPPQAHTRHYPRQRMPPSIYLIVLYEGIVTLGKPKVPIPLPGIWRKRWRHSSQG